MRMPHHLLTYAAVLTMAWPGSALRAADYSNPYNLPRCPDDPGAGEQSQVGPALSSRDRLDFALGTLFSDSNSGILEISDGVEVSSGDRKLSAENFRLDETKDRIEVSGEVKYSDPQIILKGETGNFVGGNAEFEGATFELPLQPARGAASSLSLSRTGVLQLKNVQYTTCPEGSADWQIRADSVSIDTNTSIGTARDARVEFFGVPIIRLPRISFPVGNARKSGLLFPSLGTSSNSGVQLSVPYYFNIAPEQDLTLTPTYYTQRGVDLESEYRLLTRRTRGQVRANLLPEDRKADRTRSRLKVGSITELTRGWRLTVDAENVSDARYFEDFAQGADGASIAFLPRLMQLSYRSDQFDTGILLRNFQTLDQELPQLDRPHTEMPRLYARGNWQLPGSLPLNYGFDTETSYFRHGEDVQGWRFNAMPQVGINYEGAGYFVRPTAALDATQYRLHDVAPGSSRSPGRTLPILSLDGGLQFERDSGRRGQRRMTFEPRLLYLYVPYQDQSQLPVFDTAEPDLNWIELFRNNRYSGIDRISDANQLSAGFTTRLYSSTNGTRFLSTTVGQTFYFSTPRVSLPDEPPVTGHTSDLIAQVELQAFKNWSVSSGLQWDRQESRTAKAEVQLRYQPEARSVVNLGYRFQHDRLEQADVSAAWPVFRNWRLYGRALYSLQDNKSIEHFAGFEYSSCCWNLRFVARDYVSRRSGERDQSFYLQLELKGLSNVGLAADAFLEKAIRGYSNRRQHH